MKTAPQRVVIWPNAGKSALLLCDVTRDAAGQVNGGTVVNGNWRYHRTATEHQAKSGNTIVTRWPITRPTREVVVSDSIDYNEVIAWAEKQR